MEAARRLAADCPRTTFILQHAGMPEDLSGDGRRHWAESMRRLAGCRNVVVKLSGLGTFIHRNDCGHIDRIVPETVERFGADRCLFGSNFPIEKLWTDYASLIGAYRDVLKRYPTSAQRAILRDNAARIYRLG
jgi:predicted TIM-barrel fold metal-dependent hydrolase